MKYRKLEAEHNNLKFVIEEDKADVGAYLYVYDKGKCTHDYLQDNIQTCKEFAFEDFGVPIDKWVEVEANE